MRGLEIVLRVELVVPGRNFNPRIFVVLRVSEGASGKEIGDGIAGLRAVEYECALLVGGIDLRLDVMNQFRAELQAVAATRERKIVLPGIGGIIVVEYPARADAGKPLLQVNVGNNVKCV